jgi:hypothetical protein
MRTSISMTRLGMGAVVMAAIGAALFRVVTAPDRVSERRDTARSVCAASGGQWVADAKHEMCVKPDGAPQN